MNYDIKIDKYGTKRYYINNVLHREDGPAKEWYNGDKYWYKNGLLHRENNPTKEYADGSKEWYKNGRRHREDGPAIEHFSGNKEWRLNNKIYGYNNDFTNDSWRRFVKTLIFS